jgi:hypothetical protein
MFYASDSNRGYRMREQVVAHLRTPQVELLARIRNAPFAGTLTNNQSPRWCPMRIDEYRVAAGKHIDVNDTEALNAHALADNQRRRVILSGVPSKPTGVREAGRHKRKPHRGPHPRMYIELIPMVSSSALFLAAPCRAALRATVPSRTAANLNLRVFLSVRIVGSTSEGTGPMFLSTALQMLNRTANDLPTRLPHCVPYLSNDKHPRRKRYSASEQLVLRVLHDNYKSSGHLF